MGDYLLVTPALNERPGLPALIETLQAQTVRPALWLIVDDGSTDGSLEYLRQQAESRPWMTVAESPEAAEEYLGAHIARVKRWGHEEVARRAEAAGIEWAYAGTLDADLQLPADHYERLIDELEANPRLGVVSSVVHSRTPDGVIVESFQRNDLPRGGTQFFRRQALEVIGGLPPWPGYDGAANVKCRLAGWELKLLPDLVAVQERETATRFGAAAGYARKGRYAWFLGLHPAIVAARAAAYSVRGNPTAGVHFVKGWLGEAAKGQPRCPDPAVRRYYGRERLKEYLRRADRFV